MESLDNKSHSELIGRIQNLVLDFTKETKFSEELTWLAVNSLSQVKLHHMKKSL